MVARIDTVSGLKPAHRAAKFEKEMVAARKQLLELDKLEVRSKQHSHGYTHSKYCHGYPHSKRGYPHLTISPSHHLTISPPYLLTLVPSYFRTFLPSYLRTPSLSRCARRRRSCLSRRSSGSTSGPR